METNSRYDADVLSLSLLAKDVTILRGGLSSDSPLSRVVSIGLIEMQGFATQIIPYMAPPIVLSGDPNSSLLVLKTSIASPQLSERIDIIGDVIDELRSMESVKPKTPRQHTRVLHFVPRIKLDFIVEDVAACIIPASGEASSLSSFILSSTQCVMSFSTSFKHFPIGRPKHPEITENIHTPLEMDFCFHSVLGPAFVTIIPKPFHISNSSGKASGSRQPSNMGDPLLSLSTIEFVMKGQTLGGHLDSSNCVSLDLESTLADIKCVTDALSVELWQPSAIASLSNLFTTIRSFSPGEKTSSKKSILDQLPADVKVHFAIGHIGIIVTGRDINPKEDLDLSRGIALKAGLSVQLCTPFNPDHHIRDSRRFTNILNRQRLGLPDDISTNSISSSGLGLTPDRYARLRCAVWDLSLRTSLATEYDADQAYIAEEEAEEVRSSEFLWMKYLGVDVSLNPLIKRNDSVECEESLQISIRVPYIKSRVQLLHIYCALLAFSTIQELSNPRKVSGSKHIEGHSPRINITGRLSVDTMQFLVKLPLQEEFCAKFDSLIVQVTDSNPLNVGLDSLLVWVPSPTEDTKWEELLWLRTWKLDASRSEGDKMSFSFEGDGARLRLPFNYIIADLILDLNVFAKSIKHLITICSSKKYEEVGIPEPEAAKIVPNLEFKVQCLSIEAMDDPLESKLGLIWRAGQDAVRTRLERDEAFEAKLEAIKTSDVSQSSAPDQRFTAQHTVSAEDAYERLMLVHTMSWMSLHREVRDEQRRNEEVIKREMKGRQTYSTIHEEELLVPLAAPLPNPPLLRLLLSHLSLRISPAFESSGLTEFLNDLGNGLPYETQYTLLIPVHLDMNIGASCITLRDYPLPLLNIVQCSSSDTEAWSIVTDLVIAEELGDSDCVIWKDCLVVPTDTGLSGTQSLTVSIPKTTMPVKTYASPIISIRTKELTEFCWGVSYSAALQDVMRVLDSLSTPPPDVRTLNTDLVF